MAAARVVPNPSIDGLEVTARVSSNPSIAEVGGKREAARVGEVGFDREVAPLGLGDGARVKEDGGGVRVGLENGPIRVSERGLGLDEGGAEAQQTKVLGGGKYSEGPIRASGSGPNGLPLSGEPNGMDHILFGNVRVPLRQETSPISSFAKSSRALYHYVAPEVVNGHAIVRPTWEMAESGKKLWANMAVGYFLGKHPPFMSVKKFVMSIWKGLVEVKANTNGFFFFRFESEECMSVALEGGPWMFYGQPLFLEQWKEGMTLAKKSHKEVPIWVKFRNIPLEYWTVDGLSMVASAVGKPLYPDAFTAQRTRLDYARVCVVVDMSATFRDHIYIVLPSPNGEYCGSCRVEVEYEWKPARCAKCDSFGHKEGACATGKMQPPRKEPLQVYIPKSKGNEIWETVKKKKGKTVHEDPIEVQHEQEDASQVDIPESSNAFALLTNLQDESTDLVVSGESGIGQRGGKEDNEDNTNKPMEELDLDATHDLFTELDLAMDDMRAKHGTKVNLNASVKQLSGAG